MRWMHRKTICVFACLFSFKYSWFNQTEKNLLQKQSHYFMFVLLLLDYCGEENFTDQKQSSFYKDTKKRDYCLRKNYKNVANKHTHESYE